MWTNTTPGLEAGYFNIYCIAWILLRIIEVILESKASYCLRETAIGMSGLNGLWRRRRLIILLLDLRWCDTGTRRPRPPYLIEGAEYSQNGQFIGATCLYNQFTANPGDKDRATLWNMRPTCQRREGFDLATTDTTLRQYARLTVNEVSTLRIFTKEKRHLNAGRGCD